MKKLYSILLLALFSSVVVAQVPTAITKSVTLLNYASANGLITATVYIMATLTGGSSITQTGFCYSTSADPTIADTKTISNTTFVPSNFNASIKGLLPGTTYHFRAYATNSFGTGYGADVTYTTNSIPTVTTTVASQITKISATAGGIVTNNGGFSVSATGVCWATTVNPTTTDNKTTNGTGSSFTSSITGLLSGTTYHYRAYATNSIGTSYGADMTFTTTVDVPVVTTTIASLIAGTTASSGGNITRNGGAIVDTSGVCWSTTINPTTTDNKTTNGTGSSFTSSITGLLPVTTYHYRAYATNNVGTGYGADLTFTTTIDVPVVTSSPASAITSSSASIGANLISNGGVVVTASGVCWSTTLNPTIADSKTTDGSLTGSYISSIAGLSPSTTYHYRTYATNSIGTSYGSDLTFTTLAAVAPIVTSTAANAVTSTTASSGGSVTSSGSASVTARGVCWSTTANPTTSDSKTSNGTGTGVFTSSITGLTSGVLYHVRAYASSSHATGYGPDITFTTLGSAPTVSTTTASAITTSGAASGGNVTSIGSSAVTSRGICWSTTANPTIANSKTTDGTGTGVFTSSITGLSLGVTYHIRAYATNNVGTSYGSDLTFSTVANSTQVYLNNIAFISLAQDGTQTGVPSSLQMNSSNPKNYVNPGKLVRFKMQCFNNKTNGTNIVSGLCKVRCNDPYITLTDSTSGLNNVGWSTGAWSTDEFEIQISTTAPLGHVSYVDFIVVEGANSYYTYQIPIPIAPLSLQLRTVDDDNNPDSHGNSNGLCDPSETIESLPTLQNVSSLSANTVVGIFGNYYGATGINVWNNKQGSSGTVVNNSNWNVGFGAPQIITAGARDMLPEYDFVFDFNRADTYHTLLGLEMSGKFQLFSGYKSFIKWLVPVEYNIGYVDDVSTTQPSAITATGATAGGNIISTATVIGSGVCWSTSVNPTITDSKTTETAGTGIFTSLITGLTKATTYHVRAYATTSVGTSYGRDISFITSAVNTGIDPTVSNIWELYPNPSSGNIIITLDGNQSNSYSLIISNILGEKVFCSKLQDEKTSINLRDYCTKGIYLVQLLNAQNTMVGQRKMVIE